MIRKTFYSLLLGMMILLTGCVRQPHEPALPITITRTPSSYEKLPSKTITLSQEETTSDWNKELTLGKLFAKEGDFFRATTSFHRARLLLRSETPDTLDRKAEVLRLLVLSYVVSQKYQEAVDVWNREKNSIIIQDTLLAQDLIMLLYESFLRTNNLQDASSLLALLPESDPLYKKLLLFQELSSGEPPLLPPKRLEQELQDLLLIYQNERKNPNLARILNACLPGAGYLYLNQKATAVTAFSTNALFIIATIQLFSIHQPAAALIALGLECGWYGGGIIGAGLSSEQYNKRLWENLAKSYLTENKLFPLQMIHYGW